ncbi:MAG: hypothetical protein M1840_004903 [Geoglossum simile]|nr:MAG: hypothetical protein M1840_004903 [Geoglossum simile]
MANTTSITFSPGIPIPLEFDVQKRIQQLYSYLDPSDPWYQPEQQHTNIRAAIKLYQDGKIDGVEQVYIIGGEAVSQEEAYSRIKQQDPHKKIAYIWTEGMHHQYAQKHLYSHGPFGPNGHELRMLARLIPELGGDGTIHGLIALNDTGSDILTLFDTDMACLGNAQGYGAWVGAVDVCPSVLVEIQLVRDDNSPWSNGIIEKAMVRPAGPGVPRLSGVQIRKAFYIATGPGNHFLAVSVTKDGLDSLI